jgi:hypothetical protein
MPRSGLVDRVFIEPSANGELAQAPAALTMSSERCGSSRATTGPVELNLSCGWVVLADTFYPDGRQYRRRPTPIHPTDLLFRGVFVAPARIGSCFATSRWAFASAWHWPWSASP